jgi:hypothetical protein
MAPVTPPPGWPARTHGWWMMLIAGVLFVLAAFAAGGDPLGDIPAWTWGFAGFAAWVLSWVVP